MKTLSWTKILFMIILVVSWLALFGCSPKASTTQAPSPAPTPAHSSVAPGPSSAIPVTPIPTAQTTTAKAGVPKQGGVLRFIYTEEPMAPIGVPERARGGGPDLVPLILEPLLVQRPDGTPAPYLAESFEWSNNNNTFTMHLRKGVIFHDGTPFNAEAVKWNLDKRIEARIVGTANIASLEVVDDYSIKINLKAFDNTWIDNVCATGMAKMGLMISPTAYQKNGVEGTDWAPVGTGPFKFKAYAKGQSLEVERFDGYWGKKPYLNGIKWLFIPDSVTAQLAFESGEGDVLRSVSRTVDYATSLLSQKEKGYWALKVPGFSWALIPSGGKAASPFSKIQVREALEYALDKQAIVDGIYLSNWGIPKYQLAMSFQPPYDPNFTGRSYNADKARQLLKDAGYPTGFQTTLYCQNQIYGKDIDAVQAYLKDVGIDAKLEVITVAKWQDMLKNGWDDGIGVQPMGTETFGGAIERLWIRPSEPNVTRGLYWNTLFRPDQLETLIQQYTKINDPSEAKAKSKEIVQNLYDQAIAIPLLEQVSGTFFMPYVKSTGTQQVYLTGGGLNGIDITNFWLDK